MTMGKCNKCNAEINMPQPYKVTTEKVWDEDREFYDPHSKEIFTCEKCWAEELVEELNEIREGAIFPNFSPYQFERMEKIRKKIKELGYELK